MVCFLGLYFVYAGGFCCEYANTKGDSLACPLVFSVIIYQYTVFFVVVWYTKSGTLLAVK